MCCMFFFDYWVSIVYYLLKWLIDAWGCFQYYVWHFGGFPNVNRIGDLGPLPYCRKTLNNANENKIMSNTIMSVNLKIYNFYAVGIVCTNIFEIPEFILWTVGIWNFVILKFWHFETLIFETLHVWNSVTLKLRFFGTLELWKEEPRNQRTKDLFWDFGHIAT